MVTISDVLIVLAICAAALACVWAFVELALFLRRARATLRKVEDQATPLLSDAQEMMDALKPAIGRVDPLVERVSLTVDAANLEIMRIDGILENVDTITTTAAGAASAVDAVANAPLKLVTAATDYVKQSLTGKSASDISAALARAAEEGIAAALNVGHDANEAHHAPYSTATTAQETEQTSVHTEQNEQDEQGFYKNNENAPASTEQTYYTYASKSSDKA